MKIILTTFLALLCLTTFGQSKVMRNLADDFPDARIFMIYHSSLKMLNIEDDPDFDRMIHDIEKIKVLMIDKEDGAFSNEVVTDLKHNLQEYEFEELMVVQSKDYNIGVYILENDEIEGFFLIMDEEESFIAIDLVGKMPVGDIGQLVEKIKDANDF